MLPEEDLTALYPVGNLYRTKQRLHLYHYRHEGWKENGGFKWRSVETIEDKSILMIIKWDATPENNKPSGNNQTLMVIHGDLIGILKNGMAGLNRDVLESWFEPISLEDNMNSPIDK